MGFWKWFFTGKKDSGINLKKAEKRNFSPPQIYYEDIPGTLDLGWYYSDNKNEFQMAKVQQKDRATHFYVVGATGTGKTKFLEFLVQQDIEKGNSFGVIDPHGDLIEDIKGFLACRHDEHKDEKEISDRVVLIDPTDPNFTITFNPLEKYPNLPISEQANELISAFRKIWSDSWGVRMEDLLRNSLIALGEANFTLCELPAFLTGRAFREVVLEKVTHPITQEYFKRFNTLTDRAQVTWVDPVMNKINAFFADDRIRQIFSSPESSFNLREIMDQKKILLINLDKGKLKGSADLLGSLLMAKIQMAAFSRSDIPQSKRTPFYLYIDEFQNFATESFSVILSEARKYGLSLIMAHQTLAQVPAELRSLILGNAGVQVYFRLNRQDAQILSKEAFEYSGYEVKTVGSMRPVFWSYAEEWEHKISDLQHLSPRICYVKHKIEGGIIPIQTADVKSSLEILGMREEEYLKYMKGLPFGQKYLAERGKLKVLLEQRHGLIREKIEEKLREKKKQTESVVSKLSLEEIERPVRKEYKEIKVEMPAGEDTERQHRYLQNLIKRIAEEKGYKTVIEQSAPDGQGRIDVSLERDGKKIACEISVTSTEEYELKNIEKCLSAGYEKVVAISPDKKNLERIKDFVLQRLKESDKQRVLFFQPDEFFFYLDQETAKSATKEERVKGYKVKVRYKPVVETEKKTKREAIARVIFSALRRLKGGK